MCQRSSAAGDSGSWGEKKKGQEKTNNNHLRTFSTKLPQEYIQQTTSLLVARNIVTRSTAQVLDTI